jgi:hypothetical protein
MSTPSRCTVPAVGSTRPATMLMSVLLPAPLGPSRPNIPVGISRSTPLSAQTGPGWIFTSPRMDRPAAVMAGLFSWR